LAAAEYYLSRQNTEGRRIAVLYSPSLSTWFRVRNVSGRDGDVVCSILQHD
jgi:hypothetical protein